MANASSTVMNLWSKISLGGGKINAADLVESVSLLDLTESINLLDLTESTDLMDLLDLIDSRVPKSFFELFEEGVGISCVAANSNPIFS